MFFSKKKIFGEKKILKKQVVSFFNFSGFSWKIIQYEGNGWEYNDTINSYAVGAKIVIAKPINFVCWVESENIDFKL